MKVLVLGSGGREHAIVRALSRDPGVGEIFAAPGNPGISEYATCLPLDIADGQAVADTAVAHQVDLVVIGPEAPLVAGVADAVRDQGVVVFGPSAAAAELEASKTFAKQVMSQAQVPTAEAVSCTCLDEVVAAVDRFGSPYVVKDDGLAAGKGVVVTDDRDAALAHAESCLDGTGRVVIEEYLDGPEVSLFCISDGQRVVPLQPAQDFKRALDGDRGPNTGGMGAYTPLPWAPTDLTETIMSKVVRPTIKAMADRGTPFVGLLYAGLALTSQGLRVVEFNVRFGDPETQAVLEMLKTPLGAVLMAAARGDLAEDLALEWHDGAAVVVVVAAHNYPGTPRTGDRITGIGAAAEVEGAAVLQAGTAIDGESGELVSSGGRVLGVVGRGEDLSHARAVAYEACAHIKLADSQRREDIALRAAEGQITVGAAYATGAQNSIEGAQG